MFKELKPPGPYSSTYKVIDTDFSETFTAKSTIAGVVDGVIKIYEKRNLNVSNALCKLFSYMEERNSFYHKTYVIKLCRNNNIAIDKYLK